jgi:hypothetical protein
MAKPHKIIKAATIDLKNIYFQYVPERFEMAFKVIPSEETLRLSQLPHCDLLKRYMESKSANLLDTDYYKMHESWGRKRNYIKKKINKFIELFNDISKNGLRVPIFVSEEPLYKKFHDGYEIYEGHHRASIWFVLGHKSIKTKIIKFI